MRIDALLHWYELNVYGPSIVGIYIRAGPFAINLIDFPFSLKFIIYVKDSSSVRKCFKSGVILHFVIK